MSFDQVKQEAKQTILEIMQSPAYSADELSSNARTAYMLGSNALNSTELMEIFESLEAFFRCPEIVGDYVDLKTQEVVEKAVRIRNEVWKCLQH